MGGRVANFRGSWISKARPHFQVGSSSVVGTMVSVMKKWFWPEFSQIQSLV